MATERIQVELMAGSNVVETKGFDDDKIEIGKLSKSHLRLSDDNVSRKHAFIEVEPGGRVAVQDLGSTNGTRLNGMKVNRAYLADGDEIEVGITRFRIRLSDDLKKVAAQNAPSSRAELSRDGFYRTDDVVAGRGGLALEGALLWEDSAVQVDVFARTKVPVRTKAMMLFLFAISPLELWVIAGLGWVLGFGGIFTLPVAVAGGGIAFYFLMDLEMWKGVLRRSLWTLRHGEAVHIGETPECRYFLPAETVGSREYPLLVPHEGGWALNLAHKEVRGDVLHHGKVLTIEEAKQQSLVNGSYLPLDPGSKCRLRFGQFSMLLSYVPAPGRGKRGPIASAFTGLLAALNVQDSVFMGVSVILHVGLLILGVVLHPDDEIQIRREKSAAMARFVQVESVKAKEKEEEKKKEAEKEVPDKVDLAKDEEALAEMDKVAAETEKLEQKEEVDIRKRRDPSKLDRAEAKVKNREMVKSQSEKYIPKDVLAKVTGMDFTRRSEVNIGIKPTGGLDADSDDSGTAFAGDTGSPDATLGQGGFAGLGEMGETAGSGGPDGPGGNGGAVVAGLDKDAKGGPGGRFGNVKFKDNAQRAVAVVGNVTVSGGALTRDIIKKYINRQKGSIVLCYKREVQKDPDLEGKVIVAFVISAQGKVMQPGIQSSSLGSAAVESCIVQRLGLWRFPSPENGGAVKVSYPFLFRAR